MTIPKIIHQTVPDKNKLDSIISENISKLRSANKNWDYRLYGDPECRDFILECYGPKMLGYYDRINPRYGAARADLFRYLLVYEHGGIYLDIKSTVDGALDDVVHADDVYLLSKWKNGRGQKYDGWGTYHPHIDGVDNEYQQWHIVASAKHPFLEAVIEKVQNNIDSYDPFKDGVGKLGVMKLTGPIAYTAAIQPVLSRHAFSLVDIEDLGFRYSIVPSTKTNKYGHVELFANHYTTLAEPVVTGRERGNIEKFLIRNSHHFRSAYRSLRRLVKRTLERSKA